MRTMAVILPLACALWTSCSLPGLPGDGVMATEHRPIASFTALVVDGNFDVAVSAGKQPSLTLTSDRNLLPHIKSAAEGDRLRIYSDEPLRPTRGINVVMSTETLSSAALDGAIRFTSDHLSSESLRLHSVGAGSIRLEGTAGDFFADLTGASELQAGLLAARNADVNLVGASHAAIAVSNALKASISGAGSLTYSGSPQSVEKHIIGAGSVRPR